LQYSPIRRTSHEVPGAKKPQKPWPVNAEDLLRAAPIAVHRYVFVRYAEIVTGGAMGFDMSCLNGVVISDILHKPTWLTIVPFSRSWLAESGHYNVQARLHEA
jgi:hypothetical protein